MTARAGDAPYHGVYLGDDWRGVHRLDVYAWGECVRREPIDASDLIAEGEALTAWLERKYPRRALLQLVRP